MTVISLPPPDTQLSSSTLTQHIRTKGPRNFQLVLSGESGARHPEAQWDPAPGITHQGRQPSTLWPCA